MFWPVRATEATDAQIMATGAAAGYSYRDPIDGDLGWRPAGSHGREVPPWTQERARTFSVAAYRSNPMAKAIIDTYVAFAVGDSGVALECSNPQVAKVAGEFWADPRNGLGDPGHQELALRSTLLNGERLLELLVGPTTGVTRFAPIEPSWIQAISLVAGNPLWPDRIYYRWGAQPGEERELTVAQVVDDPGDADSGLRRGEALWLAPFRTLEGDTRSMPFLAPIVDWLDAYDQILSNLIDRTALARYLVWDVTVQGGEQEVKDYIAARGGSGMPRSGSVEVHNQDVTWEPKYQQTGAYEDSAAAKSVLTLVAGGAGLAKTWLADPEDSNRATSLTMAEPVRRRVQSVQRLWLGHQTELIRFAVDRAVAAGRLRRTVKATDARTNTNAQVPASQTVMVTGPEVAAADAEIGAQVLLNLATGLEKMVQAGTLSREGAVAASKKAWENFMGVPWRAELGEPDAPRDDVAQAVDDASKTPSSQPRQLRQVAAGDTT